MTITFWGVRGSRPTPDRRMLRYGGNTSCVSIEIGNRVLVLDAGTGFHNLGAALSGGDAEIFILLTHLHRDHVLGFPFFEPLYQPGRIVHVLDYRREGRNWSLLDLLDGVHFPRNLDALACSYRRVERDAMEYLNEHGFGISRLAMNHPGGAYGYRIAHEGRVFVHMPDNELDPPGTPTTPFQDFVAFCRGADVLSHDAQLVPRDGNQRRGWGHSLVQQACDLAVAAEVRHLVLFHHDPGRTDDEVDALQHCARTRLNEAGISCTAAHEGLGLNLFGAKMGVRCAI